MSPLSKLSVVSCQSSVVSCPWSVFHRHLLVVKTITWDRQRGEGSVGCEPYAQLPRQNTPPSRRHLLLQTSLPPARRAPASWGCAGGSARCRDGSQERNVARRRSPCLE